MEPRLTKCQGTGEICSLSRVRSIEHLDLTNFRKKKNNQNVRYIEVLLIINLPNPAFSDLNNYCNNSSVFSRYDIATALETQEPANKTA